MKIVFWCAFLFCLSVSASELAFDEKHKDVTLPLEKDRIEFRYTFKNAGGKPVTISKMTAGCNGCLSAVLENNKRTYQPNEAGVVVATFQAASYTGKVEKAISLWLNDNMTDKPDQALTCSVDIQPVVKAMKSVLVGS